MKLVVVESPAKVKTIKKILGKGYKVSASMGHLVDLPKKEIGVDPAKSFKPKYVVTNRKALKKLKEDFKGAKTLIIASDLDREGEAIGWHVAQRLGLITPRGHSKLKTKDLQRIVFHSITKDDIEDAISNPRKIDMNLVDAQQARRILDRLVGYNLSPLIWKKISYGLSAGRVQSVAVKLIVDREREREKFKKEEYWRIFADLSQTKSKRKVETNYIRDGEDKKNDKSKETIEFELVKIKGKDPEISKEAQAKKIIEDVKDEKWIVDNVEKRTSKKSPKPPFITSTLQRTCSNIFGYSAKKTMRIAQTLYEKGMITYMRTDSLNINLNELKKIRKYIESEYGSKYLSSKRILYKSKSSTAQEAHEAIRPTNSKKSSGDYRLRGEKKKVYDLIRNRILACQMKPASLENTKITINLNSYTFQARGKRIVFDGYLKVYKEKVAENIMPIIEEGDKMYLLNLLGKQYYTQPPARYSEASLIKTLEKFGIGRPSTYAPIISTIITRKYIIKEQKQLIPTPTGIAVTKLLEKYFKDIVDTDFTSDMEKQLDKIAAGNGDWVNVLKKFYNPFIKQVKKGEKVIDREEFTVIGKSKYKCPICSKKMVQKIGRFGVFLSCKDFPKCKGIRSIDGKTKMEKRKEIEKTKDSKEFKKKYMGAPETEDGKKMTLREGRYGKYWAHPDYPKVKETSPLLLRLKCPECGEPLVERRGKGGRFFIGCSGYPKCRYIKKERRKKEVKGSSNETNP